MKAILSIVAGGPEALVLEEVDDLQPGPGEVVIAVRAASVNFPDNLIIRDLYQFKPPRPFTPGGEVAGVIKRVGEGVGQFSIGDRVIASGLVGGFAEEFKTKAAFVYAMPDGMAFDEASALITTYGTSQYALKMRAAAKPGQSLLVLGAAGGVGLAAIELGKAMGLQVLGAVSSEEKAQIAREAGADDVIVYPVSPDRAEQKALADAIKTRSGGGVDVVYDPVGGAYAEPALRALNWEGTYLVVGFPAGIPNIPLNLTLLKGCQVVGVFWGGFVQREPARHAQNIAELFALYREGKIRPRVSRRFVLADAPAAILEMAERRALGKIVVLIGED